MCHLIIYRLKKWYIYGHFWCFPLHVYLHEGVRSFENGVTDSCDLTCECWELNLDSLKR